MEIRDTKRKGFGIFHNEIIDHYASKIGPSAGMVYMALARFADNKSQAVQVSRKAISELLGISRNTVSRSIQKLEEEGLITRSEVEGESPIFTLLSVGGPSPNESTPLTKWEHPPHQMGAPPLTKWEHPPHQMGAPPSPNGSTPYKEVKTKETKKLRENSSRTHAGETSTSSEAERLQMMGVPDYLAPLAGRLAETYRKANSRPLRWSDNFTRSLMSRYQEYAESGDDPEMIAKVWDWLWTAEGDAAWHRTQGCLSMGNYLQPEKHDGHVERFRQLGSQVKETPEEKRARLDRFWEELERKEKQGEREGNRVLSNVG